MPVLRYAVVLFALVAMAGPSAPPRAKTGLAGSEWRVVEVGGAKAPGAGTVRFTQSSIRGKAPCNAYFGAFRESERGIEIGGINETRMRCQGRMDLERAFLDNLGRARAYRVDGATLLLIDGEGNAVVRLAS